MLTEKEVIQENGTLKAKGRKRFNFAMCPWEVKKMHTGKGIVSNS